MSDARRRGASNRPECCYAPICSCCIRLHRAARLKRSQQKVGVPHISGHTGLKKTRRPLCGPIVPWAFPLTLPATEMARSGASLCQLNRGRFHKQRSMVCYPVCPPKSHWEKWVSKVYQKLVKITKKGDSQTWLVTANRLASHIAKTNA